MRRFLRPAVAFVAAIGVAVGVPIAALGADNGNAPPTLSFFSGGGGAHADWLHTDDQPAGDSDQQAIRIHDTTSGYAGVLVHHVYGIPTASYPNSTFDFKSDLASPGSLGYPRLEIIFSDGGDASLRPLTWQQTWSTVADPNWDNNHGGCGFRFEVTWQDIQNCHPGTFVTNVYITTDPGIDVTFLIDNLNTDGKHFSSASDNGSGNNDPAYYTPDLLQFLTVPLVD